MILVEANPHNYPGPNCPEPGALGLDLDPVTAAEEVRKWRHDVLAGVDVVVHPVSDRLPALGELLRDAPELLEGVDALVESDGPRQVDLRIRGRVVKHRFEVLPIECGNGSANELDVLLRHRLPRQPGGFEGFVLGLKAEDRSDDLSVAELVKVDLVDINRDPARLAPSLPMRRADHCIRGVDVFLAIDLQLVEGIGPEAEGLSNRFDALNRDRLIRSVLQILQHGIWCEGLDDAVEIPSVQSSNSPFRHLDVLLRHQLRSIARRVLLSRQSSAYSRARLRAPPSSVSSDPSMRGSTARLGRLTPRARPATCARSGREPGEHFGGVSVRR